MAYTSISVTEKVAALIKRECAKSPLTISQYLETAVTEKIAKEKKK